VDEDHQLEQAVLELLHFPSPHIGNLKGDNRTKEMQRARKFFDTNLKEWGEVKELERKNVLESYSQWQ
jgi:hypothetical protein